MNRILETALSAILWIVAACHVCGQISYTEIPAPPIRPGESIAYEYTTTWGLRDDPPDKFTLGPGWPFRTREEAQQQIQAKIGETQNNGWLTVTHGLITRVPYVCRTNSEGPTNKADSTHSHTVSSTVPSTSTKEVGSPAAPERSDEASADRRWMVGKKFSGWIGDVHVTFHFVSIESVVISTMGSKAKAWEAKWHIDTSGQLIVRASNAELVGKLAGQGFVGIATTIDRSLNRTWSLDLQSLGGAFAPSVSPNSNAP